MKTPREKYYNDPSYSALVDTMVAHIHQCYYTPSEMREAALLASIIYEESKVHSIAIPKKVDNALKILSNWSGGK